MLVTKQIVADRISAYLHHEITLAQLVVWAEQTIADSEFARVDDADLAKIVGRIGVADVRAFGLTWDDCEALLRQLGYRARVEVTSA
jgi:hypothetical protein